MLWPLCRRALCQDVKVLSEFIAKDAVSGHEVVVSGCDAVILGSPCKSLSTSLEHKQRLDSASCIADATHISGIVWRACQNANKKLSVPVQIDEQVYH